MAGCSLSGRTSLPPSLVCGAEERSRRKLSPISAFLSSAIHYARTLQERPKEDGGRARPGAVEKVCGKRPEPGNRAWRGASAACTRGLAGNRFRLDVGR